MLSTRAATQNYIRNRIIELKERYYTHIALSQKVMIEILKLRNQCTHDNWVDIFGEPNAYECTDCGHQKLCRPGERP